MPIANCLILNEKHLTANIEILASEWARLIPTNQEYITISFIKVVEQLGKQFEIMVQLYLPSIWKAEEVEKIQLTLLKVLTENLKVKTEEIFIMTSIIQSAHVVENGEIQTW